MTRGDIKIFIKDTLGESDDNPAALSPLSLDGLISTAAEEIARATSCYYRRTSTSIVSGQATYCDPALFKLKAVTLQTPVDTNYPNGQFFLLEPTTPMQMDASFSGAGGFDPLNLGGTDNQSSAWRNLAASTQGPFTILSEGLNRLRLVPAPGWSDPLDDSGNPTARSLTLEGFGVPDPWPKDADECPLVETAHMAVAYKACMKRVIRWNGQENMARRQMLQAEYENAVAALEAQTVAYTYGTQSPVYY